MTRADWFTRNCGGGWRTARTAHRCDRVNPYGLRCLAEIPAGAMYFDTNQHNARSRCQWATTRLCEPCAIGEISG